jgi:cytidylate kinase
MAVVTISRQLGSGGEEIGQAVARALGAAYLDKEILQLAAARFGTNADIAAADDRQYRLMNRLITMLLQRAPAATVIDSVAVSTPLGPRLITRADFRQVLDEVMREVAQRGQAVIAGWGGQAILQSAPHVVHVHVTAPLDARVQRVAAQRGLTSAEARRLVQASDRERAEYLQSEYGIDWLSPELYDLIINTGRLTADAAVSLIVTAARARAATQPVETPEARLRQEFYTAREAAELLMLHPDVIRHAVYAGELPAAQAADKVLVIHRRDLLNWLERQQPAAVSGR